MRWTDEQLEQAIARVQSWHGVARALGLALSGGGMRSIERRARELRLNTSHFTGQRRWSDRALRDAIAEAESWADVALLLGLGDTGDIRPRMRGHAVRLGIDFSHLEPPKNDSPDAFGDPTPMMLRFAAESLAVAWFALRGIPVAIPSQPAAYDLQITLPEGVKRVQVKSTTASWTLGIVAGRDRPEAIHPR